MKVESESEVAQLCPTLSDPMDCSPPGSSIHGIFQARVLEWVPLPSPLLNIVFNKNKDFSLQNAKENYNVLLSSPSSNNDKL